MSDDTNASILIILRKRLRNLEKIEDLSGLAKEFPFLSAVYSIFFLALAGFPPFWGFFARISILKITILNGWYITTFLILMGGIFSIILSMRFINKLYFDKVCYRNNVIIQKTEDWEIKFLFFLILLVGALFFYRL